MSARAYLVAVTVILARLCASQRGAIEQAGKAVARTLGDGHRLWAFGTGHSHLLAEELYSRRVGSMGWRRCWSRRSCSTRGR